MLRSLKFVRKLGIAVGPQRLASHRVGSLNSSEMRLRLDGYYCLEDASIAVACPLGHHQQRRDYVTNAAVQEPDFLGDYGKLDAFTEADQHLKRYGKVYMNHVNEMLQAVESAGNLSSSHALLLIRCCGDFLFSESTKTRTALTAKVWQTIKDLGVLTDVSHYNAYIQANLDNEADLSPVDLLKEMKEKNIEPNRVTFQKLVEHYCSKGDITGTTKILEHMNEKGLPLNESVFNSLIKGHSVAGDLPSALRVLDIMREAGIEPTSLTYTSIVCAHARKGDMESILKVMEECKTQEISFSDTEILEVIYTLATNKHLDLIDKMISLLPKERFYRHAATSYISKLIHGNRVDVAYKIHLTLNDSSDGKSSGNLFMKKLVSTTKDVNEIIKYCNLTGGQNSNEAFSSAVFYAFTEDRHSMALPLFKAWKKSGGQIREHFFYPLFASCIKKGDSEGVYKTVRTMVSDFKIMPFVDTLRQFVVPHLPGDLKQKAQALQNLGVTTKSRNCAVLFHAMWNGKFKESADFIATIKTACFQEKFIHALRMGLEQNRDVKNLVDVVHHQYWVRQCSNTITREILSVGGEDEAPESAPNFAGRVLLTVINLSATASHVNEETAFAILNGFIEKGMSVDSRNGEFIQSTLKEKSSNQSLIELASKLVSENLTVQPFPLQDEAPMRTEGNNSEKLRHIQKLARSNELDEVEKELEELDSSDTDYNHGFCCTLINAYSVNNNLQKASEWYKRLDKRHPSANFSKTLALRYSNLLVKNGQLDDALAVLSRAKGNNRDDSGKFLSSRLMASVFNACPERVEEFFEVLESNEFFGTYDQALISQLIKNHLDMDRMDKALDRFTYACENLKITPCVGYLMKKLVTSENAKSLQDVTKLYTKIHGEANALLHLAVVFAECDRPRQAKKILQVPGISFWFPRLMTYAEYFKKQGNIKGLENVLQATTGAFRDITPLYSLLLDAYNEKGDWKKCLSLWIQMQENDVQPAPEFLEKLEKILIAANQEVPFART